MGENIDLNYIAIPSKTTYLQLAKENDTWLDALHPTSQNYVEQNLFAFRLRCCVWRKRQKWGALCKGNTRLFVREIDLTLCRIKKKCRFKIVNQTYRSKQTNMKNIQLICIALLSATGFYSCEKQTIQPITTPLFAEPSLVYVTVAKLKLIAVAIVRLARARHH